MKNLKHYFLGGLIFSGTVIISFIGFAAYTNLPNQNNGDALNSSVWNNLVNKVNLIGTQVDGLSFPTGAVMAFNLSTCPTGWSNYTRAVGRTIIGVGNGAGNNTNLEDVLGEKSSPAINLTGGIPLNGANGVAAIPYAGDNYLGVMKVGLNNALVYQNTPGTQIGQLKIQLNGGGTATDNMQPSIALLYCVKN